MGFTNESLYTDRPAGTAVKIFDFFLFTSLFIALCALAMVYQTAYLFHLQLPGAFYFFVLFGTLCSYNFHWYLTPRHLPGAVSYKTRWSQLHRRHHLAIALLSMAAAALCFVLLRTHALWLLVTAVFTFLYSAPKLPFAPFFQLRRIAYGKTIFLALAWTHITVMLPLLLSEPAWETPHYLFSVNRFFYLYAICILFDLRDRDKDQKEGIKSLVTQLDLPKVQLLFWCVAGVFFLTCLALLVYEPWTLVLSLLVPGLLVSLLYRWFLLQRSDYVYYFLLDGLMIFSLPLLLILQF